MSSKNKYVQLYNTITDRIKNGDYSVGDKLPTELDFANEYGCSRQTVRQALAKLESDKIIYKVQGSGSFISDSALPLKKTMRIAVITTYISTYIFPSILRGIETTSTSAGYSILLKATNNSIAKEHDILENISAHDVDGVIVEGTKTALPNPNLTFYRSLADSNIPLVFFNGYYPQLLETKHSNILYVVTDDYQGGYELTSDLIRKGHTSIGGIFKSDDIQGMRRFSGYMDALVNNHIPVNDEHVLWFNTETKFGISQQLSQSCLPEECTAVVCYNDEITLQAFELINFQNKKITALRSFDGTISPQQCNLDFYSLQHPKEILGLQATKKLIGLMNGDTEKSTVLSWE
ncbi:GntR family transcriptional regulator [Caproiciproducens faecalis]|uniref:GntR family transcriptional regulator n=1 Tax=Caproiciproducens faecalis TaxID=2820301 RepID=A0ABS7DM11_9FIRM|nr:GntR family transcriptional regulator [Caproiciproducens faecalis]MBW7571865.1 GntR family transcriptional regulator [Caproiciproducens faecalis]